MAVAFAAAFFAAVQTNFVSAEEAALFQDGYRIGDYRAPVPRELKGARIVSTEEAYALWREGKTVFVDVMPHVSRPPDLPPETIWRDPQRKDIPGSAWLPDVGFGRLTDALNTYFQKSLNRLTKGNKSQPVLFYCLSNCWMSWNAAKRALEQYGYSQVIWYPDGTDSWTSAGHTVETAKPEPDRDVP